MARLAVVHTKTTGSAAHAATTNPTGDIVVDIDLAKFTSMSDVRRAFDAILLALASGKELTP